MHGALCYGYSGDCLLASMVGGRSGNRGRCSQSCRLRYDLRRPGDDVPCLPAARGPAPDGVAEPTRVMSTSDLAAIGVLPRLLGAGVTSLKIEGRMKDAAYVGVTTAVYREALDAALADADGYQVRPEWSTRLEQSFSRSFTTAHLDGRHHEVRSGGRGGHRGVLVGRVAAVDERRGEVRVRLAKEVSAGDLVYLYTPWGQTEPVRVQEGGDAELVLRLHERVAVKDRLFRLEAADAGRLARDLVAGRSTLRPVVLRMCLVGEEGRPAALAIETEGAAGVETVTVTSARPLAAARTAALTAQKARDALGALGGTPYGLGELEFAVADGLFLAVGDLKDMRRRAVAALDERRLAARRRSVAPVTACLRRRRPPRRPRALTPPPHPASCSCSAPASRRSPLRASTRSASICGPRDPIPAVSAAAAAAARPPGFHCASAFPRSCSTRMRRGCAPCSSCAGTPCTRASGPAREHSIARAAGAQPASPPLVLEYPLQGLNGLAAGVAAGLAGVPPAAVVASPEASLEELAGAGRGPWRAVGRAWTRRRPSRSSPSAASRCCTRATGWAGLRASTRRRAPREHVGLLLEDAKGYEFPADVDAGGTRIFNARVTNLAPNLDELRDAGVATFIVVQAAIGPGASARRSPPAASRRSRRSASRERSTTGHLFRGVA